MFRRTGLLVAVLAMAAGIAPAAAASPAPVSTSASAARAPYCGITWGSQGKTDGDPIGAHVVEEYSRGAARLLRPAGVRRRRRKCHVLLRVNT